jgi:hypothetical protein
MAVDSSMGSRFLFEVRMFVDANNVQKLIRTYWVRIPNDAAGEPDGANNLAREAVNATLPEDFKDLGPFNFEISRPPSPTPENLCSSIFPALINNRCKVWLVEDQFKNVSRQP